MFRFEDVSTEPGESYRYRVAVLQDSEQVVLFETEITTPAAIRLHPNTPNPSRGVTRIDFSIDREADVTLSIYDVSGRWIRTLVHGPLPVGSHAAVWDGRDEGGVTVASGLYTVVLTSGGTDLQQKCVVVK